MKLDFPPLEVDFVDLSTAAASNPPFEYDQQTLLSPGRAAGSNWRLSSKSEQIHMDSVCINQ